MTAKAIFILMAEDDPVDFMLAKEAMKRSRVYNEMGRVPDGEELLAYLRREGKYHDEERYPTPGIVLLDLNMPKMDGRQALKAIRTDERIKHIPVVILTTSDEEEEILRSYGLGANSYICKPVNFNGLVKVMQSLDRYWFNIVALPGVPQRSEELWKGK